MMLILDPLWALICWFGVSANVVNAVPTKPVCSLSTKPTIPGADVLSIQSTHLQNTTVAAFSPLLNANVTGLDVCSVDLVISHHGANDSVKIKVWLPTSGWNGRYLATGGSGYAAGLFEYNLAPVVKLGYAAASTDAGLSGDPYTPQAWALKKDGTVNVDLLTNFASRSVHDMAVAGKLITAQYYGQQPHHSYWSGCSTGGRQGLMSAQKYPQDFDGIVAGSPAIDWARYVVAEQWPQVVMNEEGVFPSPCVLQTFTNASIAACDTLDGVQDGVISNPQSCKFNPLSLVGTTVKCADGEEVITQKVASVVASITHGPPASDPTYPHPYSLNPGTALDTLANTTLVNGTRIGVPFFVNAGWIEFFVKKDPSFNLSSINYTSFKDIFVQSQHEYGSIIGSNNPDLSRFQAGDGKAIVWHGLADQIIYPGDTVNYYSRVEAVFRNSTLVDQFYRTFLAPGVDHCGISQGAVPVDPLSALVAWVEDQNAPDVLPARKVEPDGTIVTRDICRYPLFSRYNGTGDVNLATSYTCAPV